MVGSGPRGDERAGGRTKSWQALVQQDQKRRTDATMMT
jgi:hypothetical protein